MPGVKMSSPKPVNYDTSSSRVKERPSIIKTKMTSDHLVTTLVSPVKNLMNTRTCKKE